MKVFVAGATGVIGKQLVPRLVAAGHEVVGMRSRESKRDLVAALGAKVVVADVLDADQVLEAVGHASPEVIVHQLTSIGSVDLRHQDRDFALTNRLRTEGTDHLLSAGRAVGVRRFVAQSAVYGNYERSGGASRARRPRSTPHPRGGARDGGRNQAPRGRGAQCQLDRGHRAALRRLLRSEHVALTGRRAVRDGPQREFPLVGNGAGRGPSSTSTTPRTPRSPPSNTASEACTTSWTTIRHRWPVAAGARRDAGRQEAAARSPIHRPYVRGELGVTYMTEIRGASNSKAKRDSGGTQIIRIGVTASARSASGRRVL